MDLPLSRGSFRFLFRLDQLLTIAFEPLLLVISQHFIPIPHHILVRQFFINGQRWLINGFPASRDGLGHLGKAHSSRLFRVD